MENIRLYFIVTIILFDNARRCGSSLISSSTKTISAASTAISLPTPPIAIPTSAFFKAGASLIPSPIIHTLNSFSWYLLIQFNLSSGRQFAYNSLILSILEIDPAALSLSPVNKTGCTWLLNDLLIIFILFQYFFIVFQ